MSKPLRVIVAGGRDFGNRLTESGTRDREWLETCKGQMAAAMHRLFHDPEDEYLMPIPMIVISGAAPGADTLGSDWAVVNWTGLEEYPADWNTHGKKAGIIRNQEMAEKADVLVAFWDGESRGTKHMIDTALKQGLEVHVYRYSRREA